MAKGDRFFHFPTNTVYDRPEERGLRYESVGFESQGGVRLHGWFLAAAGRARGTVVHCHGNAGNITGHYRFVDWLPERGWNVLCFDYRGYGQSQGTPTREGTVLDTLAALDYVKTRPDVDGGRVVLFGQSLGGTVAILAAAQRDDLAGLAVEGAFTDYQAEAWFVCRRTWWLWGVAGIVSRFCIGPVGNALDRVGRLGGLPKLFICGGRDGIVDHRQTIALHDAAPEPKELWVIADGRHADALIDGDDDATAETAARRDRFCQFLDSAVNGKQV